MRFYFGDRIGGWRLYGVLIRDRWYVGVSVVG